jgi:hypothetical protein
MKACERMLVAWLSMAAPCMHACSRQQLQADILVASGDAAGARSALENAGEFARNAQLPPQYDKQRQQLAQREHELGARAAAPQ